MTNPLGPLQFPTGPNQSSAFNNGLLNRGTTFNPADISRSGWSGADFFANINPLNPPPLRTFVYSPQVRVIIAHGGAQFDVSDDVTNCTLIRPENSAASFSVTLQNKGLRYTPFDKPAFSPMDRIVVYMKKTSWLQVFTGYLDKVPYRQLYPGVVEITATCTMKRLMHAWFNPDLPESANIWSNFNISNSALQQDSGLGQLLQQLLIQVGGWQSEDIHIQEFPQIFFEFLRSMMPAQNQTDLLNFQRLRSMVLGDSTLAAPMSFVGGNPNAGVPGPSSAATGMGGTLFYLTQIVLACDEKGLGPIKVDNKVSSGMQKAGLTGEGSSDPACQVAWTETETTNNWWKGYNKDSDGAILGVAAAMVETGNGAMIRNLANAAVVGSEDFPNDGLSTSGTSCGILGQQNYPEWGTTAQKMNPKQAAGMFMAHLAEVHGWRSMKPGEAIMMVQRTADADPYDQAYPLAKAMVQAYRQSGASALVGMLMPGGGGQTGTTVGSAASTVDSAAGGQAGAPGLSGSNSLTGAISSLGASTPGAGTAAAGARQNKPQPDSEGAINWARTQLGKPYKWGATGPGSYDCSGLVMQAFKSIGIFIGRTTYDIRATLRTIPNDSYARGDLIEPTAGHVVLCAGGTIIEAQGEGVPVHEVGIGTIGSPSDWVWVGRACLNGGQDPSAPFNPPESMGPGQPPGALQQVSSAGQGAGGAQGNSEGIATNLFGYMFLGTYDSAEASMLGGRKAFIDGQPLIEAVQAVAGAGLRSWSSGPDGSFIAWYPDYWGLDGKPAVLQLEDIELKDVRIDRSDDPMATHVYINGNLMRMGQFDEFSGWLLTAGVVTVEDPDMWLWRRLVQVSPVDDGVSTGSDVLHRFGIRPLKQIYAMAGTRELEFLIACKVFMEQWSKQFQTEISMTFMPELFPGMRVNLNKHDLQVYVTSVTHVCSYQEGFRTQATIVAPSTPWARQRMAATNTADATPRGSIFDVLSNPGI